MRRVGICMQACRTSRDSSDLSACLKRLQLHWSVFLSFFIVFHMFMNLFFLSDRNRDRYELSPSNEHT